MKNIIIGLLALCAAIASSGQSFEGKIVYQNSYKSKMPSLTDDQFTSMMGSTQEYYIKEGNYKSVSNGSFFKWQTYVNKDNKIYTRMASSDTVLWNDGKTNADEILKAEISKDVTEILGYKCDELVLTCKSGTQKYYYSSHISAEAKQFTDHKFGNWYDYLSKANALPLKSVIDNAQFTLVSVATEVKPMKLEQTYFELPPNTKTMKSPY